MVTRIVYFYTFLSLYKLILYNYLSVRSFQTAFVWNNRTHIFVYFVFAVLLLYTLFICYDPFIMLCFGPSLKKKAKLRWTIKFMLKIVN